MRVADLTWMQVEAYLEKEDLCVLPLGCTEQHAHLSLATDTTLADRVAVEAAEPLGVLVFPAVPYGITPYFMAYPGTVTVSPTTYERLLTEVLGSLRRHGFRRIAIVNGHGGNTPARPAAEAWARRRKGVTLRWHDWWKAPRTRAAIDAIDPEASHASWMESFPWTRVRGAEPPSAHKPRVDLSGTSDISPARFRALIGDGSFGGYYERPEEEMGAIWKIAVEETRAVLTDGW
ncbi:MAG: creatininase family protein [Gemmatimonadetes bacterium]|nr:creatininase family protein [Gemmatimonadota bacterium]